MNFKLLYFSDTWPVNSLRSRTTLREDTQLTMFCLRSSQVSAGHSHPRKGASPRRKFSVERQLNFTVTLTVIVNLEN